MNHKWYSSEDSAAQCGVPLIIDLKIKPHGKENHSTPSTLAAHRPTSRVVHTKKCGNKEKHLFSGSEDNTEVLQDQRFAGRVGEVDSVEGDGACARPVGRRLFVSLPGSFTLQLCILNHSLHWCHLKAELPSHTQICLINVFQRDIPQMYNHISMKLKEPHTD